MECPICTTVEWHVQDVSTTETLGRQYAPHFSVVCGTCGFTRFFNAIASGLLYFDADGEMHFASDQPGTADE